MVKEGKGEIIHVRVTGGEMKAVRIASKQDSRTISNFVRCAIRGELLQVLGMKKLQATRVKNGVETYDWIEKRKKR